MAIYSCNISNISRAKGSCSLATLSYISGQKIRDERTGELYQYGHTDRVTRVDTILPESAPAEWNDPVELFNSIEQYEKASDARTAKKIIVALPREFSREENIDTIEEFIKTTVTDKGYAATYAIHEDKGGNNPHAHILIPNRPIDEKGEWSRKSRKEYALDEKGERVPLLDENGNQKLGKRNERLWKRVSVQVNPLDKKETLLQLRTGWALECNKRLSMEKQISEKSYQEQGIDLQPTIHEGYAAREIEKNGGISSKCEENRAIKERNNALVQLRNELRRIEEKLLKIVKAPIRKRFEELKERSSKLERQGETKEKGVENDRIKELLQRSRNARSLRGVGEEYSREGRAADGERAATNTDTAALIREARAGIDRATAKEENSGASRANREAERERLRAERKRAAEKRQQELREREQARRERERDYGPEL